MKRRGVLNADLAMALATLGHTDTVVVGDCGLPRPPGVRTIDLALVAGIPRFADVLRVLAEELVVEATTIASEAPSANPEAVDLVRSLFGEPAQIPHEEFKVRCASVRLFVRTGEATPYANVILRCGVPF